MYAVNCLLCLVFFTNTVKLSIHVDPEFLNSLRLLYAFQDLFQPGLQEIWKISFSSKAIMALLHSQLTK